MKKAVKIQVFPVLLAWLIIFIHGVIPHNHIEVNNSGHHQTFHETSIRTAICDVLIKVHNEPKNNNTCHFSNLLFNSLNQDDFFIYSSWETHLIPVNIAVTSFIPQIESYLVQPYYGSNSLRAPPSSLFS